MAAFLTEEASLIGGQSIESTLYSINTAVDKTFDSQDKVYIDEDGITQNNKQVKKFIKSRLVFQMSQNLPIECKELKPFLRKWPSDLMYCPNQDYIQFMETVRKEVTRLHKSEEFRTEKNHSATKK